MRYLTFGSEEKSRYKICILVNDIRRDDILQAYIEPFGLDPEDIIVISLHQEGKKTPVKVQKAYIEEMLVPSLTSLEVEYLIIGDGEYFKTITKSNKVEAWLGYVLPTDYGPWYTVYVPNYRTIFYTPEAKTKIAAGIDALQRWMAGTYRDPGNDIIKFAEYPDTVEAIETWLEKLLDYPALSCDIEGFSLKHYDAGIGTITFCWSKHEGIAFPVDILDDQEYAIQVRSLLRSFFERYQGRLMYHHIAYDVYVLIYQLFMEHLLDNEGLLRGLEIMLRNWDCTKLISYLATNSCAGNQLGLKTQSQAFAGNYAVEEIKDIRKIPLPQLLQYNLVDGLATWYVYEKHWGTLVADQQLAIYRELFQPATADIIQMQLTGMPEDMEQVRRVKDALTGIHDDALARLNGSRLVQAFSYTRLEAYVDKKNSTWVKKRTTVAEVEELAKTNPNVRKEIAFNPNSNPQLAKLLYEVIGLPVIDLTDTKQPATGGDTLEKLINHTEDPEVKDLIQALIDFAAVEKILTAFIPAMEGAQQGPDGWYYLFGNFNLGGTVSGRLSSSDPNLQNLPANVNMKLAPALLERFKDVLSPYVKDGKLSLGKLIKSCFVAPPGWFFSGIDFSSLEDRISALTTKDPNKLKVYTDGYDGHCLRAYAYFADQMPDIDGSTVESINTIEVKYKDLRQKGKNPTFALTYQGNFKTLMKNYGFSEELARSCEASYQTLYKVSVDWVNAKLNQACIDGYVTVAFGLRVRTPLLKQVVRGTSKTPFEAEAEGRTAGNALGQSWCLLNSRAGSEFMGKVRASEHRHAIKPCAQIHDAQYYLVRDDIDVVEYANIHVVKACEWQNHPDIWHDEVKLGGEFSIFYPDWSKELSLPNRASQQEICEAFTEHLLKLA